MSGMELFHHCYQNLVHSLPMENETFITELKKHGLLSEDISTKMVSKTSVERASYFLDNVIKPDLCNNHVLSFNKLLKIMKESELENVKELTITIKSELILRT